MLLAYPDENLEVHRLTLAGFSQLASHCLDNKAHVTHIDYFLKLVLAGRAFIDNDMKFITLDACQELPSLDRIGPITGRRDIERGIVATETIPFLYSDSFSVWPVPPGTFLQDNHLKGKVYLGYVSALSWLLHGNSLDHTYRIRKGRCHTTGFRTLY